MYDVSQKLIEMRLQNNNCLTHTLYCESVLLYKQTDMVNFLYDTTSTDGSGDSYDSLLKTTAESYHFASSKMHLKGCQIDDLKNVQIKCQFT